ncbi:GNAT family N-acetyltransferase [Cohnella thailandensis]|uniref:GNAT family N-acetyltransferase n=1 Tax=Cohnella thailandensis TaxID=557557 RepID=A0A841SV87_9BACL|nr:GNAT family N-acetyltransferase [Cohnella thailandensis]MBB6633790.1 GNAT family N-acetyltransferase [Cohnella thailandensis]MBP1976581.1 GNAT superfamily N-acetyltransferase [Cohnella thailandensis]
MPETKIRIRDAAEADREELRKILIEAYEQYASDIPDRWEAYKESILASVDGGAPKARLVAELNGEIVGSALLFDSSAEAYGDPELGIHSPIIRLLAVSPSHRGQGIATAILRESARRASEWGAETLHLHTSDVMAPAVRLYEYLGFERDYDKDVRQGDTLVKSYKLQLKAKAFH